MDGVPIGELLGGRVRRPHDEGGELHRRRRGRCTAVLPPARARRAPSRPRSRPLRLGRAPRERGDLRRLRAARAQTARRGAGRLRRGRRSERRLRSGRRRDGGGRAQRALGCARGDRSRGPRRPRLAARRRARVARRPTVGSAGRLERMATFLHTMVRITDPAPQPRLLRGAGLPLLARHGHRPQRRARGDELLLLARRRRERPRADVQPRRSHVRARHRLRAHRDRRRRPRRHARCVAGTDTASSPSGRRTRSQRAARGSASCATRTTTASS